MLKKYGKFYADWKDTAGKRRRKTFDTKKQALQFQRQMREASAIKKAQARAASQRRSARGPKQSRGRGTQPTESRGSSKRRSAKAARSRKPQRTA
jgi:hypothetical protein